MCSEPPVGVLAKHDLVITHFERRRSPPAPPLLTSRAEGVPNVLREQSQDGGGAVRSLRACPRRACLAADCSRGRCV